MARSAAMPEPAVVPTLTDPPHQRQGCLKEMHELPGAPGEALLLGKLPLRLGPAVVAPVWAKPS